jgi:hypothetical protein
MKQSSARRKLHIFKNALRSVLILSVASLLFSCGSENSDVNSVSLVNLSESLSLAVQCSDVSTIAAGANHTVGLKEDGTVVAVGDPGYDRLNVSAWTNIRAIAAGKFHTVGLKEDGTVVAVGFSGNDRLNVSTWTNIKAIAAGANYTVGLKEDGTVVAVGYDNYGQRRNVLSWTNIKAIAAGTYHTVGLKEDGTVVAVGFSGSDRLNVSTWTNIKAIAAGANHTVGLREDGTVVAVGYNGFGQLDVSSLFINIMPVCDSLSEANQDVSSPITTSMITGTLGNNGWYVSDVQMTLTATDNDGGSGVKEIHYTVDGTETIVQGSSASVSIVGDGTHTVTWYAIDNAGNVETPSQEMSFNIDTTSPSIPALGANSAILWPPNHKMVNVVIGGSVADGGSGIASTMITVTDEYGTCNTTVQGFGRAVPLEAWREGTDRDGRLYTITAVITDKAGNRSTGMTTVLVPHNMKK